MDLLIRKLGSHLDPYLPHLLQILLGVCATSVAALERPREEVTLRAASLLKAVRSMALTQINQVLGEAWSSGYIQWLLGFRTTHLARKCDPKLQLVPQ